MRKSHFFSAISGKKPVQFIENMRENAPGFGFRVHEVTDMKELYNGYNVKTSDAFEAYILTLCSPEKSFKSIMTNPERNAAIITQKHIVIYRGENGGTVINYLTLPEDFLKAVFPDDKDFAQSIKKSCQKRIEIIKKSL
jgi:hypothetical protein